MAPGCQALVLAGFCLWSRGTGAAAMAAIATTALLSASAASASTPYPKFLHRRRRAPPSATGEDLLHELEGAFGAAMRRNVEARVPQLEEAMSPTFRALPKLPSDRLSPGGARYLLHRWFVSRHNWYVFGFDNGGQSWDKVSPSAAFAPHGDSRVQSIFGRHVGSRGLSLRETVLLAATLECLVEQDVTKRLRLAYKVIGVDRQAATPKEEDIEAVVDAFMVMYVRGLHTKVKKKDVLPFVPADSGWFNFWPETRKWLREVREDVVSRHPKSRVSFETTSRVVQDVARRYGDRAHNECLDMKRNLMQYERGSAGRVALHELYTSTTNDTWQYAEHTDYLRDVGALDEADSRRPSIIIPNYIHSPSNCGAATVYYSICCINECEPLLAHIEEQVAAPDATPAQLADIVRQLPSPTVAAPRDLHAGLVERLEAIAAVHRGRVPLHGRLFAQWLHNVYPHECPFPHLFGTTRPLDPHSWMRTTGKHIMVTDEDVEECSFQAAAESPVSDDVQAEAGLVAPWQPEEELFINIPGAYSRSAA